MKLICGVLVCLVGCDPTSDPEAPQNPDDVPGRVVDPGLEVLRGDELGSAVALDGTTMAIGAPGTDCVAAACDPDDPDDPGRIDNAGAVYVFELAGGTFGLATKLTAPPEARNRGDRFGASVSLSGDLLVVGAPGDSLAGDTSGAVYVFTRDGSEWTPQP